MKDSRSHLSTPHPYPAVRPQELEAEVERERLRGSGRRPSGQHIQAELGRFVVPEQYDHPMGRKITLAFLRLKSTSPQPGPPVIYLAGGPGGSAIHLAKGPRGVVFLAMREAGDVIALEQRGVGRSELNLECPGTLGFPLTSPGDRIPLLALFNKKSRECASYWRARGRTPNEFAQVLKSSMMTG